MKKMKVITRTIWLLSLISLLTDTASEMLYPVMPIYLKSIGFSIVIIGILEGLAEATAGLSKGYFGKLSDHLGKRVPFVQLGYGLSAISKPMLAILTYPLWILFARTLDRMGKGIRTGARDAILSDESTPENKGKVFGFHRSMDTFGAVLGPGIALLYLYFNPKDYKTLFFIAFLPGLATILVTLLLKEKSTLEHKSGSSKFSFFSFLTYWKQSPPEYRKLVTCLLLFTLFNSSDVFLLLKMKNVGMNDTAVIGIYIFYNLVYAIFSYPFGILGDKIGLKTILLSGLGVFSLVYFGFSFNSNTILFYLLFFMYGIYAASTEGISKAWISNISDKKDVATAIGTYTAFQSICTLLASSIAGWIWFEFGAEVTFLLTGLMTVVVIVLLFSVRSKK